MIQIDLQPLSDEQRAELRRRVTVAVANAIGSPVAYVSVIIRSQNLQPGRGGRLGPYDRRELMPDPRSDVTAVKPTPAADSAAEHPAHG